MSTLRVDSVDVRIERWRKNLVDTSLKNRLLDIKESRLGCLKLTRPGPQDIYATLVERKASFEIELGAAGEVACTAAGQGVRTSRDAEQGKGSKSLMAMRTKAREALREQGINILFLTIGILEWSAEGTGGLKVRSPLVLVPVELGRSSPLDPYDLKLSGEDVTINPTLEHKLRSELGLAVPSLPEEGLDLAAYLASVEKAFARLGWSVVPDAYLGLFKFPKMCMYDELSQCKDLASAHPVVRALAGEPLARGELTTPRRVESIDHTDFQVLDADSSQQEAIGLAMSGASFVLQGPPGTGKSQTITNIISESLARGRTVLFVSEKMAALEVVRKRLEARGLGDYCLELHNHDRGRQEVVDELSRCLTPPAAAEMPQSDTDEVERAKAALDGYVDALHQVRDGLGMSYHELLSELTMLRDAPEIPMTFANLDRLGRKELEPLQPLVRDLQAYAPMLAKSEGHPWSDCLVDSWKLSAQSEIVHRLSALKLAKARLLDVLGPFSQELELPAPVDLKGTADLIVHLRTVNLTPYPFPAWLDKDPAPLLPLLEDMRSSYLDFGARMGWLRQMYHEDVLALDLKSMQRRFQDEYGHVTRVLSMQYRSDMGKLRSLSRGDRKLTFEQANDELQEIIRTSELATHLHALETECTALLGSPFRGENTDWDKLRNAIKWTKGYYDRYGPPTSPALRRLLCGGPDELVGLKSRIDTVEEAALRLEGAISSVGNLFNLSILARGRSLHEISFDELQAWAQDHLDNAASFQEWTEISRVRKEATERGLGDLLTMSAQGQLPTTDLWNGVRKRFFTLWHDLLLARDRRLRDFSREEQERAIAHFTQIDQRHLDQASLRARTLLDKWRRELCEIASPEQGSGLWVLRHEVSRKRKLRPLRELFSLAGQPIQVLKPCLLMSPMSVSTYLDPSKVKFDLVIFDEASQVRPEDAIGPIMRSRQVIVVGDSKQLPPTDFFRDLNEEEEEVPDLESILDECSSAMPQRMLLWHYRSRQESLIAFSNEQFYGGRLLTFPSALRDREGLGVSFVHVPDGRYDRSHTRKNVKEAERIADLVVEHVTRRPDETLGVVAFSEPQQMAIIEQLEKRMEKDPTLGVKLNEDAEEGFFVKNLENVQGDERDVMLFSVGYGKDAKGRVFQNFGPLNRPGGERRLNVAVTRARKHVKLVSSLQPAEIEASTPGAAALKAYMEYAKAGEREAVKADGPYPTTPLEADVRSWLESKGLVVEEKVGRSLARVDLAIMDPERKGSYLLGILTDGPSYRKAGTTRDRERLREEVLTGLGWNLLRVWSQDWIKDRDAEVARIMAAIENAKLVADEKAKKDEEARPAPEVLVATLPAPARSEARDCSVYAKTKLQDDQALVSLYRTEPKKALTDALAVVVREEGPVHLSVAKDRLKELVTAATGKKANIDKALVQAVHALEERGDARVDGEFLWDKDMDSPTVRRCDDHRRDVDQVCDAELEALVLYCVPKDKVIDLKEVVSGVTEMLGYKRPTLALRSKVERTIAGLAERGVLGAEEDQTVRSDAHSEERPVPAKTDEEEACP